MSLGSREKKSFTNNFSTVLRRQMLCGPTRLCLHSISLCMSMQARVLKLESVSTTSSIQLFPMLRTFCPDQSSLLIVNVQS